MIAEERRTKIAQRVNENVQSGLAQQEAELVVATEIGVKPDTIRRYLDLENGPKRLPDHPVARGIVLLRCLASEAWRNACPWGILEGRPLLEEQREDVISELWRLAFESDRSDEDVQVMLAVLAMRTEYDRFTNETEKRELPIARDKLRLLKGLYFTLLKEVPTFRRLIKEINHSGKGMSDDFYFNCFTLAAKWLPKGQYIEFCIPGAPEDSELPGPKTYTHAKRLSLAEKTAPVGPDPQPVLDAMKEDRLSQRQPPLLGFSAETDGDETDNVATDAPYECESPIWER